jgi:hypothetical protein
MSRVPMTLEMKMSGTTVEIGGRRRRRKPSVAETREAMAECGDVEGLWHLLTTTDWTMLDQEEVFRQLLRAIEVSSGKDPASFSADLLRRMLAFTGYLVLRAHHLTRRAFSGHDRHTRGRAALLFPHDVTTELLPSVIELQRHATEIAEAQARTARLWQLAGQRRSPKDLPRPPDQEGLPSDSRAEFGEHPPEAVAPSTNRVAADHRPAPAPCPSAVEDFSDGELPESLGPGGPLGDGPREDCEGRPPPAQAGLDRREVGPGASRLGAALPGPGPGADGPALDLPRR